MAVDTLQNGRYHHLRLLGSGGMGEVYLMEDTRVSRQVAIKVTRSGEEGYPEKNTDSDAANRLFQREAKAIAALDHPNILPLYDFGEETGDGTTITYMVMPFCGDGSLEGWLRKNPQRILPPQEVAYLVEQAAEGLQFAHDHNVIHLDVKPSNFLLRSNKKNPDHPMLLLADFGIARNFTTVSSASHTIRGTPTAMAPEQWASSPGFASDQYALAVMAYELLAGRPPFTGSMEQLMYQHFNAQPQAPSTYNPQLPAGIDAVILRALAKKPEERFPSVTDFANALTRAVQGLPVPSPMEQEAVGSNTLVNAPTLISGGQEVITPRSGVQVSPEDELAHNLPTVSAFHSGAQPVSESPIAVKKQSSKSRLGRIAALSIGVVILLIAGTIFFYVSHQSGNPALTSTTINHAQTPSVVVKLTPSPTATKAPNGLYIAGDYNGSMTDETTNQTSSILVVISQTQENGTLTGSFTFKSPTQGTYTLTGTDDTQGQFGFTVQQPAGQQPLYFFGTYQQQNKGLHGYFCRSTTNSCLSNTGTGYFTAGPRFQP